MKKNELQAVKLKFVNNNIKIYQENKDLYDMYNQYIANIVELIDYLKTNEPDLFYTVLFDILIYIGFFSAQGNFTYKESSKFNELDIKNGINVISGEGVCRNIACFYEDVFSHFYNYPLKMCCLSPRGIQNDDTKTYGNHIINLTFYNGLIYGFDLVNHCVFIPTKNDLLKSMEFDETIKYIPGGNLLFTLTTSLEMPENLFKEMEDIKYILKNFNKRKSIDLEEYKKIVFKVHEFIDQKIKSLQSFMLQNQELTSEIKKKMLSLK